MLPALLPLKDEQNFGPREEAQVGPEKFIQEPICPETVFGMVKMPIEPVYGRLSKKRVKGVRDSIQWKRGEGIDSALKQANCVLPVASPVLRVMSLQDLNLTFPAGKPRRPRNVKFILGNTNLCEWAENHSSGSNLAAEDQKSNEILKQSDGNGSDQEFNLGRTDVPTRDLCIEKDPLNSAVECSSAGDDAKTFVAPGYKCEKGENCSSL
jgi:hypothetical protein